MQRKLCLRDVPVTYHGYLSVVNSLPSTALFQIAHSVQRRRSLYELSRRASVTSYHRHVCLEGSGQDFFLLVQVISRRRPTAQTLLARSGPRLSWSVDLA